MTSAIITSLGCSAVTLFLAAFKETERRGLTKTNLYGFDSFEGLPDLDDGDTSDGRFFRGQFAAGKEQVTKELTERGVDWSRAELIEGYYEDSLTEDFKASLPRKDAGCGIAGL